MNEHETRIRALNNVRRARTDRLCSTGEWKIRICSIEISGVLGEAIH